MRLSATDRIIREAEQQDDAAVEAVEHPDTEKVSAAPFVALGIPAPRMPTPLGGGVDIEIEDDDGQDQDDEEGETQVDAKRSAAALKEMRSLQASRHTPPPATMGRSDAYRPRGVPPGRPDGTAMSQTPWPVLAAASPAPTLAFTTAATVVGPPPGAPYLPGFIPPPAQPDDNRPDHMFSSSRIQFGAIAMPPAIATTSWPSTAPRRTGRVGRRTGVVIAASTAIAVALIAGAWTAKNAAPVHTIISGPSVLSPSLVRGATAATPPRAALGPVVVATPPAAVVAQPASEPTEAPPAPTAPEAATVPAPVTAATEVAPVTTTRTAPLSRRAQAAAAKKAAIKARVAKKKAALAAAAARRKARAHKTTRTAVAAPAATSRPAPTPTMAAPAGTAARPSVPRSADAPRGRSDPDDTLPITD